MHSFTYFLLSTFHSRSSHFLLSFPVFLSPLLPLSLSHHCLPSYSPLSPSLSVFSFPLLLSPLLSSVRLMMCGTVWARCCRLRETLPLPQSVSSPLWSWRPAAPSCHSPSYPEPYETHAQLSRQYCSTAAQTMDLEAVHRHSMPACHLHTPSPRFYCHTLRTHCIEMHIVQITIHTHFPPFLQSLAVWRWSPSPILDPVPTWLKYPVSGFRTGFRFGLMLSNPIPASVVVSPGWVCACV